MRRKAGHSMMRRAPSTPLSEGLPTWTALISRHEVRRRRPVHPRKPRDRTSKPESQASERHRSRSACSGTQHHRPCRSSDGQKPAGRTMDATDTKARESRSGGCYQAALYNNVRPHSRIGWLAPAVYAAQFSPQRDQGAALRNGSAPWPIAPTVHDDNNRQTLVATG